MRSMTSAPLVVTGLICADPGTVAEILRRDPLTGAVRESLETTSRA